MANHIPPTFSKEDVDDLIYHAFAGGFGNSKVKDSIIVDDDTQNENGGNSECGDGYVRPGKRLREVDDAIPFADMEAELKKIDCNRTDAIMFTNYDNFILYGVDRSDFSPVFQYKFQISIDKDPRYNKGGRSVGFLVGGIESKPLPAYPAIILRLIQWTFSTSTAEATAPIKEDLVEWLSKRRSRSIVKLTEIVDVLMEKSEKSVEKFTENAKVKKYFFYDRLQLMKDYYNLDNASALPSYRIQELSMYFDPIAKKFPDPLDLVFRHRMRRFRCGGRNSVPLPELKLESWIKLCNLRDIDVDIKHRRAIEKYQEMKDEVKRYGCKYSLEEDPEQVKILSFLMELGAVCVEKSESGVNRYYLRHIYMAEELIVISLKRMMENFGNIQYTTLSTPSAASVPPTVSPCSEQMKLMNCCRGQPISIATGMGGSGKTDAAAMVLQFVHPDETLFATFQSVNAANACSRVTRRAFTIHKLMMLHAQHCWRSPYFVKEYNATKEDPYPTKQEFGITFKKCPFENIKFVVLDEGGILYDELFAQFIYALVICGMLCRLLVAGDPDQQDQSREGRLMQDLIYGLPEWVVDFTHCHRYQDKAAVLLHKNAKAIKNQSIADFKINKKTNILHTIPQGLDFPLYKHRKGAEYVKKRAELKGILTHAFQKYGIGDQENVLIIARTHEIRRLIVEIVKETYHKTESRGFVKRQKITYAFTNYDIIPRLYHNEIMVIDAIQDVRIDIASIGKKDREKIIDQSIVESTDIVQEVNCTISSIIRETGVYRRLICHVRNNPLAVRIVPWWGDYREAIHPAAAITEASSQGLEADIVVSVKPGIWKVADTNKSMGMVKTRTKQKIIWIAPKEVLVEWLENPAPIRRSALFEKIGDAMEPWMEKYPTPADTEEIIAKTAEEGDMYKI